MHRTHLAAAAPEFVPIVLTQQLLRWLTGKPAAESTVNHGSEGRAGRGSGLQNGKTPMMAAQVPAAIYVAGEGAGEADGAASKSPLLDLQMIQFNRLRKNMCGVWR